MKGVSFHLTQHKDVDTTMQQYPIMQLFLKLYFTWNENTSLLRKEQTFSNSKTGICQLSSLEAPQLKQNL